MTRIFILNKADLGDLSGCRAGYGNCASTTATYIWKRTLGKNQCKFKNHGSYLAQVLDNFVIVNDIEGSFTKTNQTVCNNIEMWDTA